MTDEELIKKYVPLDKQTEALEKLATGYPVQYIIGNVEFLNTFIKVNENVLIPRFETELLVDKTIKYLNKIFGEKTITIADLGCGSGCIAIALKKNITATIFAFDISTKALALAQENAFSNNVEINFKKCDISKKIPGHYDCIISNPPYIAEDDYIDEKVKKYEPHIALYAKENGLYFYKKILSYSKDILNKKFLMAFEIGENQVNDLTILLDNNYPEYKYSFEKDLTNRYRYLFIYSE